MITLILKYYGGKMRNLITALKSAIMGSKTGHSLNDPGLKSFIHEMDKKLLHLEVAYSKWNKGVLKKEKFISILDQVVDQMSLEFTTEAKKSPYLMNVRDKSGNLFIEKINKLQMLSYSLKSAESDDKKFLKVSTEIKGWVTDEKIDLEPDLLQTINKKISEFRSYDELIRESAQMIIAERETDLKKFDIQVRTSIQDIKYSKALTKDDFLKWRTLILNLMRNSIDAIIKKQNNATSDIDLIAKQVLVSLTKNGDMILTIEDTGCGMDEQTLNKIFNLGYSTKQKSGIVHGVGLNPEMKQLLEKYGSFSIKSEVGKGTTFTILINK